MKHYQFLPDPVFPEERKVEHGNKSYAYYKELGWFPKSKKQVDVLVPEHRRLRDGCYYAVCTMNPLHCKECVNFGCEHNLQFLVESM